MKEDNAVTSAGRWRRLQAHIAFYSLAVVLVGLLALSIRALHPAGWLWPSAGLAVLLALGLALLWRYPSSVGAVGAVGVVLAAAAILGRAWGEPAPGFPPVLDLFLYVSLAATVFSGPGVGDAATGALLAALAFLAWRHPWLRQDEHSLRHLGNLMIELLVQQALVRWLWRELENGVRQLERAARALEQHLEQARSLARAAFTDARGLVEEIRLALGAREQGRAQALAAQLRALLEEQRERLPTLEDPPRLGDIRQRLLALRALTRERLLLLLALGLLAGFVRNLWLPGTPPLLALVGVLISAGAFWVGRRNPVWGRWGFRAALLIIQALFVWIALLQFRQEPHSPMVLAGVFNLAVFLAALLDTPALSGLLLAVTVGCFVFLISRGADIGGLDTLAGLALAPLAAWTLWRLPGDLLERLHGDSQSLGQAMRHRRRLLCTLFHDLANPLHTLTLLLHQADDPQRAERMAQRMQAVLEVAASLELAPPRLQVVGLRQLLAELPDLYQERLGSKGLVLAIDCADLEVLAQPELLRESVLGNLLGNAIKFSPLQGRIHLAASPQEGGWVELSLQDQGPGIPDAVRRALAEGARAPSSLGSQGETGNGYGLALAKDYLAQMGGELVLALAEGGGTLAQVRLKAA